MVYDTNKSMLAKKSTKNVKVFFEKISDHSYFYIFRKNIAFCENSVNWHQPLIQGIKEKI